MNIKLLILPLLMAFQAVCSANYVAIDSVTSGVETTVTGPTNGLFSGGGYSVERTIFQVNAGFQFDTNRWQIIDNPGASSIPVNLAIFSFNSIGGSFGDIWSFNDPVGHPQSRADGIAFNYTAVDFDPNNVVGYSVQVSTDSGYDQTFALDTSRTTFKSRNYVKSDQFASATNIQLRFFRNTPGNGGLFQLRGNISVTPEPGAIAMFGCVATAFGLRRRR